MKTQKIYLDTSVPNFLFAADAPELKEATIDFFENFNLPKKYDCFISEYVITEIEATKNDVKKLKLFDILNKYPIKILVISNQTEIVELAEK